MAFGKSVSQLNLGDIHELQKEDVREGLTLEYKSDSPGKEGVLKELCAFANTFGGHVIFGVKEFDQERGRIEAIPGLDRIPNFEQKLRQWAAQWLYPPLTEIQVSDAIPVRNGNRVCYVVHIPASLSAPHFLEKRKGCYIRIESHSMTFQPTLATLDEILRLADRRKALIEARERISERAYDRWRNRGPWVPHPPSHQRYAPVMIFSAVPEFPTSYVADVKDLQTTVEATRVTYRKTTAAKSLEIPELPRPFAAQEFPSEFSDAFSQQETIVYIGPGFEYQSHFELTAWGSFFVAQELASVWTLEGDGIVRPERHHLIMYPVLYLLFLRNLLHYNGFEGRMLVQCELCFIRDVPIKDLERRRGCSENEEDCPWARSLADDKVSWKRTVSMTDLSTGLADHAVSIYRQLAFGVGCEDACVNPDSQKILEWGLARLELKEGDL